MNWVRTPYGYLRRDLEVFIERGAPMSGGGTAWLIWYRIPATEVGVDGPIEYEIATGDVVRTMDELTGGALNIKGWYIHRNDAGSLAEAKETAERILEGSK